MLRSYCKTAWRSLLKNRLYSFINIAGLSVGMAVAILIGLWIHDELTFDKCYKNYDRLGQVWQFVNFTGEKAAYNVSPIPLAEELRNKYPELEAVSLAVSRVPVLSAGEKKITSHGSYTEPGFPEMLSLKMLAGNRNGLGDIHSILLSASLAKTFFGGEQPIGKTINISNSVAVKVAGVYENFPENSSFKETDFFLPWSLLETREGYVKSSKSQWDENSFTIYVQLKPGVDFNRLSAKIKDSRMKRDNPPAYKPEFFIHPMSRWHLYSDFKNGVNVGGLIQFVWLFGIAGFFVLLLACINFMNLSTARSEKRAREVGVRKVIGSARSQLVLQFFFESLLVTLIAFLLSLLVAQMTLPFFNGVAGKNISVPWHNPWFWLSGLVFSFMTGLVAGSYPALYLSSFRPVKVLKGTFRVGRFAAVPRKVLVVLQFTVSVILIIGTVVVFRQVQYAKNRPAGYSRNGLIEININDPALLQHYGTLRNDLVKTGAVLEMSASENSITVQYGGTTNISWRGKTPDMHPLVMGGRITHEFGKVIGWTLLEGRDFSREFSTDSAAIILNEAAVKLMGFKSPVGELITTNGKDYIVRGVVKDIIKESPFTPVNPSFFILGYNSVNVINIKLSPDKGTREALSKIETVFHKFDPANPFAFSFVDEQYAKKFGYEERIGKLAAFFATLAIFISCLGLFGVASFVAEQRTKEIGVRKVLGASIFNVWGLLSKEFIVLVAISLSIAIPFAYYFMNKWLLNYSYRAELSWWIFAGAGTGALVITLLTVSFHAIKAAVANPVRSLRTE